MPIKSGEGRVIGTFDTSFREHRLPTPAERAAVDVLVTMFAVMDRNKDGRLTRAEFDEGHAKLLARK